MYFTNEIKNFNHFLEKEYHRLDLWYFISFISGIIFYFKMNIKLSWIFLLIHIIVLILLHVFLKKNISVKFVLSIIIIFITSLLVCKINTYNLTKIPIFHERLKCDIIGIVELIKKTNRGLDVVVKVKSNSSNLNLKKIRISFANKFNNNIELSDEISFSAILYPISNNALPESYDFILFSYLNEIHASGYAIKKNININKNHNINSYLNKIKQSIYRSLINHGGQNAGNFIAAFLIGETKSINYDLITNVRNAGIAHILCISGLHLSLVHMLVFSTARIILNLSNFIAYNLNTKSISAIFSLFISYLYLLLSGNQIATVRAFIMCSLFIISIVIKRNVAPLRTLGVSAIIILLPNPGYIFHPSFQLSFSAVLSLIAGFEFYKSNKFNFNQSNYV